jgi:glycosyltransferase involved in cell wall biosynthesis
MMNLLDMKNTSTKMKFSIVTPTYNMERWVVETIESVISQEGDFEIEYIIVDDSSTDKTFLIIEDYRKRLESGIYPIRCKKVSMICVSQEKTGMYEAINRGFARATGDICAWINADDVYKPGAFASMTLAFSTFPETQWIKGITSTIEEDSSESRAGSCKLYIQDWLKLGIYGQEAYFVEQDSVFWRKELWQKVGPMPKEMRSATDYWLWIQMAQHTPLWSLNTPTSSFRKREGQISKNVERYKGEQHIIRPQKTAVAWMVRFFFAPRSHIIRVFPALEPLFLRLYSLVFLRKSDFYIEIQDGKAIRKPFSSYRV